ncbi:hypothetical protein B0H65DRAFT_223913 [Neurospora tetraspora]|uniref:Uncharacterized protein n=1 Tax=Neurospora tetraspora TaxID=94610 RepID=A0AAE0JCG4_9PEZI|nr:hypothetical protein B0H65DRAFT_223913 [Neurospora tetraspora]
MTSTPRPSQPDEKDLGPDDSISMVSPSTVSGSGSQSRTINLRTPTSSHASTSNRSNKLPYIIRNCAPSPGSTYIIVFCDNAAYTIVEGDLCRAIPPELLPNPPVFDAVQAKAYAGTFNWHWHCEESDGWLGFRNAATGSWVGSIGMLSTALDAVEIGATATSLGVTEQFCVRKAEDREGYLLLKRLDCKKTVHLLPVWGRVAGKRECFDAKTWEFVKVDVDAVWGQK